MKTSTKLIKWAVLAASLLPFIAKSTDTLSPEVKITDATVFFKGATVSGEVTVNLKKGNTHLIFNELPYNLEINSIQVKAPTGVTVRSVNPEKLERYQEKKTIKEKQLEEKMDSLEIAAKRMQRKKQNLYQEHEVLMKNSKLGTNQVNARNIEQLVNFYKTRLDTIENNIINLDLALKEAEEDVKLILEQLNKIRSQRLAPGTRVTTRVFAEKAMQAKISVTYFTNAAGWKPVYDFNVASTQEPVILRYKADVFQQSGKNWKNIKLKLTTADPTLDSRMPEERVWYIGNNRPNSGYNASTGSGGLRGRIIDQETNEPIPFVNVTVQKNGVVIAGSASDFDGHYFIKPIPEGDYEVHTSSMGYSPTQIRGVSVYNTKTQFLDISMNSNVELLEAFEVVEYKVPVFEKDQTVSKTTITSSDIRRMPSRNTSNVRGARTNSNYYFVDGIKVRADNYNTDQTVQTVQLNSLADQANVNLLEYEISTPYSILSSPKETQIDLKEVELSAKYRFHLFPSLDPYANLVAHVGEWHALNLFEGPAGIYYKNTYVGKTTIKPYAKNDTLDLVIGRDYNIIAKKLIIKDYTESVQFNNYKKQFIGWEYQIISRHSNEIELIIHDQIPKSRQKEVKIEVEELSGAKLDQRGLLTWKKTASPQKPVKLNLKYVIKHPKHMRIEL